MAKHLWTILCANASVDQMTNNLSLFGIVEELQINGAPADQPILLPAQFQLAILWMRSNIEIPEMANARFSLKFPNGEVTLGTEIQVELNTAERNRNIVSINGIPLKGPGLYHFITEIKGVDDAEWSPVNELPLNVKFG